jgi:hypothetical protein
LTNRGRELLAQGGRNSFNITKFAVADDEVDYGLYNVAHPEGSEYYGSIIENMPVLEATPDEQQIMRYKLVTLGSQEFGNTFVTTTGQIYIPRITGFVNNITLNSGNPDDPVNPRTDPTFNEPYTLIVANANLINIYKDSIATGNLLNPANLINANGSITLKFQANPTIVFSRIQGPGGAAKTGTTTATIFGDLTGATSSVTITVES